MQDDQRKPPTELQMHWGAREPRSSSRSAFDRLPVTEDQVEELIRRGRAA